jgi:hypothetical protein
MRSEGVTDIDTTAGVLGSIGEHVRAWNDYLRRQDRKRFAALDRSLIDLISGMEEHSI